uniref:ATP synthase CF0 B chain n=1 Tax=Cyanidium sp. THAL103 TaxID=3027999 RepID=A0A9Y1MXV0_9RHOD|nr:ATP synthase CF0 B chain [Cyanidium sp. THAL103]
MIFLKKIEFILSDNENLFFDSNIINISFLIILLWYLIKKFISSNLHQRQIKIVNSINDAEYKLAESKKRLVEAEEKLLQSEAVVRDLLSKSQSHAQQIKNSIMLNAKDDIENLISYTKLTIKNAEYQTILDIKNAMISKTLDKVFEKLTNNLNPELKSKIIDKKIAFLAGGGDDS